MKKGQSIQVVKVEVRHPANAIERQVEEQRKANEIASREQKTNAERLEFEKDTKNRVDISLKEYEKLKEDLEYFKKRWHEVDETLMKIARPIINCEELSEEVKRKIINGEFEHELQVIQDFERYGYQVAMIFRVSHYENRR